MISGTHVFARETFCLALFSSRRSIDPGLRRSRDSQLIVDPKTAARSEGRRRFHYVLASRNLSGPPHRLDYWRFSLVAVTMRFVIGQFLPEYSLKILLNDNNYCHNHSSVLLPEETFYECGYTVRKIPNKTRLVMQCRQTKSQKYSCSTAQC